MQKDIWREVSPLGKARSHFGAATTQGGLIYVMGGKFIVRSQFSLQDGTRTDSIECYNVSEDVWNHSELKLLRPKSSFAALTLDCKISTHTQSGSSFAVVPMAASRTPVNY